MKLECCECTGEYNFELYEDEKTSHPYTKCPYCGFKHLVSFFPSNAKSDEGEAKKVESLKLGAPDVPLIHAARIIAEDGTDLSGSDDGNVVDFQDSGFVVATMIYGSKGPYSSRQHSIRWRNVTEGGSFADDSLFDQIGRHGDDTDLFYTSLQAVTPANFYCTSPGGYTEENGKATENASMTGITLADEYYEEDWFGLRLMWGDQSPSPAVPDNQYEFELYDVGNDIVLGTLGCKITTVMPTDWTHYFGKDRRDWDMPSGAPSTNENWWGWGLCFNDSGGYPATRPLGSHVRVGDFIGTGGNYDSYWVNGVLDNLFGYDSLDVPWVACAVLQGNMLDDYTSTTTLTRYIGYTGAILDTLDYTSEYLRNVTTDGAGNLIDLTGLGIADRVITKRVGFSKTIDTTFDPTYDGVQTVGWDELGGNLLSTRDDTDANPFYVRFQRHSGFSNTISWYYDDYAARGYVACGGMDGCIDGDVYWSEHESNTIHKICKKVGYSFTNRYARNWPYTSRQRTFVDRESFAVVDFPVYSPVIKRNPNGQWIKIIQNNPVYSAEKTGVVDGSCYIRGQTASFVVDAVTPSWTLYTGPVKKASWTYFQFKIEAP